MAVPCESPGSCATGAGLGEVGSGAVTHWAGWLLTHSLTEQGQPRWKSLCHPAATGNKLLCVLQLLPQPRQARGLWHGPGHLRRFWDHHSWLLTLEDELPWSTDPPSSWTPPAAPASGVSGTQTCVMTTAPRELLKSPRSSGCSLRRNRKGWICSTCCLAMLSS